MVMKRAFRRFILKLYFFNSARYYGMFITFRVKVVIARILTLFLFRLEHELNRIRPYHCHRHLLLQCLKPPALRWRKTALKACEAGSCR